jgi:hypothetical protein
MMFRRIGRALRRRYGRAFGGPQAITQLAGGGKYNVVEVDSRGTHLRTIARKVPYSLAKAIIKRHG